MVAALKADKRLDLPQEVYDDIADVLFEKFSAITARKRHKRGKKGWQYLTPQGQLRTFLALDAQGNVIPKFESKWSPYVRAILSLQRDGEWYRLEGTNVLPARIKKQMLRSVRMWFQRHGYNKSHLQFRQNRHGVYVCWAESADNSPWDKQ